jgi:Cyclic nucleotide-binding domain
VPPRLLDLREGEWKAIGPALLLAALAVGALTLATIAADTLFVSAFDIGQLPGLYMVTAIARVAVAFGYGAFVARARGARVDAGLLAATAALTLVSGVLSPFAPKPLLYPICLALQTLPALLPLIAMNAAMECFHARQAKRLLPLVAAAATVGAIVAGAAARIFAATAGTWALLILAAIVCAIAVPLPSRVAGHALGGEAAPAGVGSVPGLLSSLEESVRDMREVPIVRIYVLNAFLGAATLTLVDFGFKAALKARFERDEMAAYLGGFNLITEGIVLAAQLFLTSRLVARFGVFAALEARPVALLVLAPLAATMGVRANAVVKLGEATLRMGVAGSVSDLLLLPAPARMRVRFRLLAKSAAQPLGALAAGVALAPFGELGPPREVLAIMLGAGAALSILLILGVRWAYTGALADALGKGRMTLDVSPGTAELLKSELCGVLAAAAGASDARRALPLLSLMGDRLFVLEDLAPAFAPGVSDEIERAAAQTALRLVRPGEGATLLAMVPPGQDDETERAVLAAARGLGVVADRTRLEWALARGQAREDAAAADLWAEALTGLARTDPDAALKQLRTAALDADSPRRAAALRAMGDLGDRRAEVEVLRALGSNDPAVYAEAARAAVRLEASGGVSTLVANLEAGIHVRATGRALALAGPAAVGALLSALPTTRGEGAFRTAAAGSKQVSGTIRAARVIARLGPEAAQRALERFAELGYRARTALARALANVPEETARALDPARAGAAMELTVAYAETLMLAYPAVGPGLLRGELHHRIGETAHRLLDLAAVIGSRALIARAHAALSGDARARGNALELLEHVLPHGIAGRAVAILEFRGEVPGGGGRGATLTFDGWLEKCRKFDARELGWDDPMSAVLENLVVLREAPLFAGLSGEELYPVGEIAQRVVLSAGSAVVRQGDPGDALFVVASGTLRIVKDGRPLRDVGRGAVFGEVALLDGAPRAATVEAVTDAEVLRVPRSEFEGLLDESPEIARAVIRMLLGYVRGAA